MKRKLLGILLGSCLIFTVFTKVYAAGATFTYALTATTGFAPATITTSGNNLALYGFSISASNANAFNSFTLTATQSNGTVGTYFSGFTLFRNKTADNFAGASQVTTASFVVNSDNTITITLAGGDAPGKNISWYYYIEANYTASVYSTFQLALTGFTFNTNNVQTATGMGGTVYNLGTPPVSVTLTSLKTPGATYGLASSPLITSQINLPIYGFSLTAGTTGATATIQSLIFKLAAGRNIDDFSTMTLYSCSSSNYLTGTLTSISTYSSTNTGTASDDYATFPVSISETNTSGTIYYFLVINAISNAVNSNIEEDYSSSTGSTITPGSQTTGYNYPITSPPYTITSNASGIQAAATPYYYGSTGDALESFAVTSSAATQLNSFTLTSSVAYGTYFTNLAVYSSSNASYTSALAGGQLTAVSYTISGTTSPYTITLTNAQTLGTSPIYYYVVADFTTGDNLFTNTTTAKTFQFSLSGANVTYNSGPSAATNSYPIASTSYQLLSPVAFGASTSTGLATVNQLNYNQSQVGILGFSITTAIPETISSINFGATITPFSDVISSFFSNVTLYYNTTDNFSTASVVPAGYTVSSLNGTTFTISGLSQSIAATTVYFYIKANFTAPTNFSATFQLSATSCTTSATLSCDAGAPVTGTNYIINPTVVLGAASTTGLAANPIVSSKNNTTLAIFSFSVAAGPANTFNNFKLYTNQPAGQYPGTNFSGYALYYNTTNSITGATAVTGATFNISGSSDTLTITGFSQSIAANTTYYYFVKALFNSPSIATTYQLNLLSATTTASKTYYTGGPINGIIYTCSGPLGVYYWEGGNSVLWENANNWLNANTGNINNGYPNQSASTDIVVFQPPYVKSYYVIAQTSKTVSQVIDAVNDAYASSAHSIILNSGITCTITNGLVIADPGRVNAAAYPNGTYFNQLQLLDEVGTSPFYIGGTSYFYNDGSVAIGAPTTFNTNAIVDIYGTSNDPASVGIFNATVTANTVIWNFTGAGSLAYLNYTGTSTLNATNSTFNFNGFSSQLNSYGYVTFTGCTVNSNSLSDNSYLTGLNCNQGTFTITGNSVINMGTSGSNGNFNGIQSLGGTFTVTGTSNINLQGPYSFIVNDYTKTNIGTTRNPVYTPQAIFNLTGASVNLGTANGSNGSYANIYNTDAAYFNLNAASFINLNGANSEILNTSSTNNEGVTGYGVFQAASTSVINDTTTTTSYIYNQNSSSYFTFLSDINGSATLGKLGTGAQVNGQYNVQRYLNGGSLYLRNYRMLSSPVNTDGASSSATNHIDLTYLGASATIPYIGTNYYGAFIGGPGSGFGGTSHTFANPLMYLYQESIAPGIDYNRSFLSGKNVGIMSLNSTNHTLGTSNTADAYGSGSPSTAPSVASTGIARPAYDSGTGVIVPPGNGYIMYYVGNNQDTAPSSETAPTSSTITASGYINQQQVQLFMWGADSPYLTDTYGLPGVRLSGITVIGNPYPSTLDLYKVWYDNSHAITPSLYQLDKTNQQFDTYNASNNISSTGTTGGVSSSRYVASGQGFYIHVDSLGTTHNFYFQEDQKAPSTTAPVFPPISNFAVVTRQGQMADMNTVAEAQPATDNANNPDKSVGGYGVPSADNGNIAQLNNNVSIHNLATIQPGDSVTRFNMPEALARLPKTLKPSRNSKKEAQQPKQTPPPPGITNPANLHLKFVVDSVDYDEVALAFNKAWSDKFDKNDSYDLDGQAGKVYLSSYTSDDIRTSINLLGDYTSGKKVKLFVKASTAGIFQLQMSDINNFDTNDYSVFLLDKLKADSLDLTLYKSYNFNYSPGTANDSTRFVLAIEHKPVPYYALLSFAGQKVTPGVQLNWQTKNLGGNTTFILQKLTAANVYASIDSLQSNTSGEFNYIDQHPSLGSNTYRLEQINELGVITYSVPVTIGYNSTNPNGSLVLYPNPAKTTMTVTLTTSSTAVQVATADIYSTSGKLIEHKVVNSNSFVHDVSAYALGAYIIELKNSNGVLVGESKFVKVE